MKIKIDTGLKQKKTDYSWQFGMGNDHAATLLRTDVAEHIKYIHDELGIKYIRFHGIFDDDMLVYSTMGDNRRFRGVPHAKEIGGFNFHEVGLVYDNVLKAGLKPFIELSFMPSNSCMLHHMHQKCCRLCVVTNPSSNQWFPHRVPLCSRLFSPNR